MAEGFEATVRGTIIPKVEAIATYTRTDTEDRSTNKSLFRRPQHRGTLSAFVGPFEKVSGVLSLVVVKDRINSDGSDMDNYRRVDLTVQYEATDGFHPYLKVNNALDEDYEEVTGFTTPGRVVMIGADVSW